VIICYEVFKGLLICNLIIGSFGAFSLSSSGFLSTSIMRGESASFLSLVFELAEGGISWQNLFWMALYASMVA